MAHFRRGNSLLSSVPISLNHYTLLISALPEDSRESRQIFTLGGITPGLAAGATLLQSGLFQRETAQLNQPCITQEGE